MTAKDGAQIYYDDWGAGQPVAFSHSRPLSADAFEDRVFFLASRGYRCIAHDRRGHGRSSRPWQERLLTMRGLALRAMAAKATQHHGHERSDY
jgi:pimeloyl-ACP methyl ester carboxylesterase